jgi:hypothetical protein
MNKNEIPIASPCGQDWRSMKPGQKGRYCDACKKTVHDLSAMTRREARALLAAPPTEGLCVRYLYDAHGDIAFRDTVPAGSLVRAKRALAAAAALALPMSLAACMGAAVPPPVHPESHEMMGAAPYIPEQQDAGSGTQTPIAPTATTPVPSATAPLAPTNPSPSANPIEIDQR